MRRDREAHCITRSVSPSRPLGRVQPSADAPPSGKAPSGAWSSSCSASTC